MTLRVKGNPGRTETPRILPLPRGRARTEIGLAMTPIKIVGTGSYVPPNILTNDDIATMVDTSDEWIVQRTGIRERRIADPDQAVSDLAKEASLNALESANMAPEELDMIILATITPDTSCPAAANWLQAKLGATNAVAYDVTAACTGFIFALSNAEQYLQNGRRQVNIDPGYLTEAKVVLATTKDYSHRICRRAG